MFDNSEDQQVERLTRERKEGIRKVTTRYYVLEAFPSL